VIHKKKYNSPGDATLLSKLTRYESVLVSNYLDLFSFKVIDLLKQYLYHIRPNVIHVFEINPLLIILFKKISEKIGARLVYHMVLALPPYYPVSDLINVKCVDVVIVSSKYSYDKLKSIASQKVYLIPPIIDTTIYRPLEYDKKKYRKYKTFLYIGPLDWKRLPLSFLKELVEKILKKYNIRIKFVIAPRFQDDNKRVRKLKNILMKGVAYHSFSVIYRKLSLEEKVKIYNEATLILFPLSKSCYGIVDPPISLLEAMSCGSVVASTRVLSIPYLLISNYNGIIFRDVNDLEHVLRYIDTQAERIGLNARKTIEYLFTPKVVIPKINLIYKKLMKI